MFAQDYMTRDVLTCAPGDLVIDVRKRMAEFGVRHVPVVEGDRLRGIVSLNSLRDAAPSKATELSIHELHFLLSKMRIEDVMKREVVTCGPRDHVEDVARTMQLRRIGAVPVVEEGRLLGVLTNDDMFRVLMRILGMDSEGYRITMEFTTAVGDRLAEIVEMTRSHGKTIKSLLSVESARPGSHMVILHLDTSPMEELVESFRGAGLEIQSIHKVE